MNHQDTKAPREPIPPEIDRVAREVVNAAYRVHTTLGPGLLESVDELCLVHELTTRGLRVERQVAVPIVYDSVRLEAGLRSDLVVEDSVIVELKAVESGRRIGLLINFNVPLIRDGIKRLALYWGSWCLGVLVVKKRCPRDWR